MNRRSVAFALLLGGLIPACAPRDGAPPVTAVESSKSIDQASTAGDELAAEPPAAAPTAPAAALDEQIVASVRRQNRSSLGRCQKEVWSPMRFDVALRVAKGGAVTDVRVQGPSPSVAWCVERAVGAWRFPPAEERSFTRFALLFQPGA